MSWSFHSLTSGTVADYIINFMGTTKYHMERGDVYLVFDSCIGKGTNEKMRSSQSGNDASLEHYHSIHTTLPTQKVTMNVVHNNVQLIDSICHYLMNDNQNNQTKLVIMGKYPTLVKLRATSPLEREYVKTNHE